MNAKLGRNEACSCGSGKKFKHCCGKSPLAPTAQHKAASDRDNLIGLIQAQRFADAERVAHQIIQRQPADTLAWQLLAQSLWMQGKDALGALEKSASLLPLDPHAHGNLGTALRARGRLTEALGCYQRAIQLQPDFAEAHNNIAGAYRDLGQLDRAAASYRRALHLAPHSAIALCNLGHVLRLQGEFVNAESCYREAVKFDPNFIDAYSGLGNALQDLGKTDEAVAVHRRAVALNPVGAELHFQLGNALLDGYRLDEAQGAYAEALKLNPQHAQSLDKISSVLRLLGRAQEAEDNSRRALEINPDLPEALVSAAQLASDRGKFVEAEALYRRALSLAPASSEALAGIVGVRKMTRDDAPWAAQADALAKSPLSPRRRAKLYYALGKYCDDLGEYQQAFARYRQANELARQLSPHDRSAVEREFDAIMQRFSPDWIAAHRQAQNSSARPVFVIGMPRSGTTLLEQIIAAHPSCVGAGEIVFWVPATQEFLPDSGRSSRPLPLLVEQFDALLESLSPTADRVVDKMPANFKSLGLIHAAYPQARFLHISRNPIDTCLSIYFHDFNFSHTYASDLEDLAHYYGQYRCLMDHWRRTLPSNALLNVNYEALIENQESWIRRIVEFIGLPWNERCLDHSNANKSVGSILTFSQWQARQKVTNASVARWRRYEQFVAPLRDLVQSEAAASTVNEALRSSAG